jgi:Vacuolar protein sorting-associated protein 62
VDEHTTERLLNRFLPFLRYDSCEAFFADSAAEWTDNPSNVLRGPRPPGGTQLEVIAAVEAGAAPDRLSLELLGEYEHQEGDHIGDLRKDYRTQYVELRKNPEYRNRIYGRLALGETGNAWLQYWFFYFYNDYRMAGGLGLHEGDWEMIQLRMPTRDPGPDDVPEEAVYAQHKHAQRCDWSDVEKHPGSDRPVVYVGRGSHASYFEPGVHETEAWIDVADGEATPSELRLELVGDARPGWLRWPGR